ncbi:hypothetical protein ID866_2207 [Astraeus odoratus]|nr:hypothetical protein ID866_2207 [Astraeus odoratus]
MQYSRHHPVNYPTQQQQQHARHPDSEGPSGSPTERQPPGPPPPPPHSQAGSSASPPSHGKRSVASQPLPASSQPPVHPSTSSAPPSLVSGSPTGGRGDKTNVGPSAAITRPHVERPVVRRPYHPNPPSNRSEWVMWVGNVPADTTHNELWRFLKRPAASETGKDGVETRDNGVTSIFLISRSNCAFVNFDTEEHLQQAIACFNGLQLRPNDKRCPRLVCRARRKEDDLRSGVGGQRGMGVHTEYIRRQRRRQEREKVEEHASTGEDNRSAASDTSEVSVQSQVPPARPLSSDEETKVKSAAKAQSVSSYASTNSSFLARNFPKRFFILKSLTQHGLDESVKRGVWATQKHNEVVLDQAYRTSKEVILIFGVNKSGEFYGYARMASRILRGDRSVSWATCTDGSPSSFHSISPPHGRKQSRVNEHSPGSPVASAVSKETPLTFFSPEHRLLRASPTPISSLERECTDAKSSSEPEWVHHERQSAPARLGPSPRPEFSIELDTPRFSLDENNRAWLAAPPISKSMRSAAMNIPSREIILDRDAPARAMRNRLSVEEPPQLPLQPVEEEKQGGSDGEEEDPLAMAALATTESREAGWGQTFKVEWLCTQRLPFQRIRHLRNPWNHDREIKVSRDGTELDPGVGQRLIDEWLTLATSEDEGSRPPGIAKPSKSTPGNPTAAGPSSKRNNEEL